MSAAGNKRRRQIWGLGVLLAVVITVVGPWPVDTRHPDQSSYGRATRSRLAQLDLHSTIGHLSVGTAALEITPPVGEPMAGYSGRDPKVSKGIAAPLLAKAVSFGNHQQTITILGAEVLLVLPALRQEVLRRTGLPARELYFTATHTHSGPGGFVRHWPERLAFGRWDQAIFDRVATTLARVATESRRHLQPARTVVSFASSTVHGAANRVDKTAPANNDLFTLRAMDRDGATLAGLVVFAAHPTCFKRDNHIVDGDYPGRLQRLLEAQFGGLWLFAAGPVGSMKPAHLGAAGAACADELARRLDHAVATAEPWSQPGIESGEHASARMPRDPGGFPTVLTAAILPVDLPPLQFRISPSLRLSPVLTSLLHSSTSYIHVVRIGELVLLGMPADYSAELALRLSPSAEHAVPGDILTAVTSFNGDYLGYLIPQTRYALSNSESRTENFLGPWGGEYFHELGALLSRRIRSLHL